MIEQRGRPKSDYTSFVKKSNNVSNNMKKKVCPFADGKLKIDYKDPKLLQKFISPHGKVLPSRISMVCAKKQRALSTAIKRARFLALLPYKAD